MSASRFVSAALFLLSFTFLLWISDAYLFSRTIPESNVHKRREYFYDNYYYKLQKRSEDFMNFLDHTSEHQVAHISGSVRYFYYVPEYIEMPVFEYPTCFIHVPISKVRWAKDPNEGFPDDAARIRLIYQCMGLNDTCCGYSCCYVEHSTYEVIGYIPLGFIGFIGLVFGGVIIFSCWKCRARRVQRMEIKRKGSRVYRGVGAAGQQVRRSASSCSEMRRRTPQHGYSHNRGSQVLRTSSSTSVIFKMGLPPPHSPSPRRRSFRH